MSKVSRKEVTAQAMVEASQEAALVIEACENKHHLTKEEALDVLSGTVVHYINADGQTDNTNLTLKMQEFIEHLADYAECVLGIKLYQDEDYIGN